MSRQFEAQYPGRCVACAESISPGDLLTYDDESSVAIHAECCESVTPTKPRPVCVRCFMEVTPSGACGCAA